MSPESYPAAEGLGVRTAGPEALARAFDAERRALLRLVEAYRGALGDELRVPCSLELNPPLWELGHIGWFEAHWIDRNPQRNAGWRADPAAVASDPDDELYDSSRIAHDARWDLHLPAATQTLARLAEIRRRTLERLAEVASPASDDALYFFRLALLHEAMHREAWTYMAQTLGIALPRELVPLLRHLAPDGEISVPGGDWTTGWTDPGFAFDNELPPHTVRLAPYAIDRAPVTWRRYLPFVEAGGYGDERLWSRAGWAWRTSHGLAQPRYLRRAGGGRSGVWSCQRFGEHCDLDLDQPAIHLSLHEAQAWCRWMGRRLPREAEWEMAACMLAADFVWGDAWEWTASPFEPHPGFVPHPYRDYSQPWFTTHQGLRGASFATSPFIRHPRYRNYFLPGRNDICAGFRSCRV